ADGARRLGNESPFSAPQLERDPLDGANRRCACLERLNNDGARPGNDNQATLRIGGLRVSESVVHVSELTRRLGATTALASVSLAMPRGAVYGLVGANGAGKTTLIKHILGLLRAESGSVRVFGLDPVADPVAVLWRIGSLSQVNELHSWVSVDRLLRISRY